VLASFSITGAGTFKRMFSFPICDEATVFGNNIENVSVLGTVHDHRYRWNPFSEENEMMRSEKSGRWIKWVRLSRNGGRHRDGIYSFRFVINHNPRRLIKLDHWLPHNNSYAGKSVTLLCAELRSSSMGRGSKNITIHVHHDCEACLIVDPQQQMLMIECGHSCTITPLERITSVELNGFIWDELDMFEKFNEHAPGREMSQLSETLWEKKIQLSTKGGIDFRADGVYQLLISVNGDEDQGYGALNYGEDSSPNAINLVSGTGFGSSHGTSYHSAPTVRILKDDVYSITVSLSEGREKLSIHGSNGGLAELVNNSSLDMQILGDIHAIDSFDPTTPHSQMVALDASQEIFEKMLDLDIGTYSINFAIGGELFLDTMGLGCWLTTSGSSIKGIGWHGKPNESNIGFKVLRRSRYRFTYNRANDVFTIEACDSRDVNLNCLEAISAITTLSIVGNLPKPLVPWDTNANENLMISLGRGRFEKSIFLEKGVDYQFKLVGNQSNWQIVFADYELDGYGLSYNTNNPNPYNSKLEDLRIYGHLTTHGNPPPIHFVPTTSGSYLVMVDLWSGAYGIKAI
jgi:hypothetical protein